MADQDDAEARAEIQRQLDEEQPGKAGFVQLDAGVWVAARHLQKIVLGKSVQVVSGEVVPLGDGYASLTGDIESAIWWSQRTRN